MRKVAGSGARTAVSCYLSEIRAFPRLTRDEEIAIGERAAAGHRDSLDNLVVANLGFVVQIATEYLNRGLPFDDLVNEGNIGLIRAASRYDHHRGLKFITYASWWVRKTILSALEQHGSTIRVPAYQREKLARAADRDNSSSDHHAAPLTSGYAKVVSLETLLPGPVEMRLADKLVDSSARDPEHEMLHAESVANLRRELSFLNERERTVIIWRFGLLDERVLTLSEIGRKLGLSRERVRQIEESACLKLRARFHPACERSATHSVANRSPERLHAVTQAR